MGHWFAEACAEADLVRVSLHRLRHSAVTFMVGRAEASSGLNTALGIGIRPRRCEIYAHALPLEDGDVADDIDVMSARGRRLRRYGEHRTTPGLAATDRQPRIGSTTRMVALDAL